MAVNRWLGQSKTVAQVVTLVVGSSTNGHTFITTMNGKSYTYVAASDTTSTIATAIHALLTASDEPEFREVTWTVDTATVTGTAATPGMPFVVSESGTGTYTLTTTTASAGPNHADDTANWSLGTLPGAAEDILIDGDKADILYGLDGIAAAAYTTFKVKASFEGKAIGLPYWNSAGYVEYRTRAWPMATAVPVTIGEGDGGGPSLVNITQTTALDLTVHKTQARTTPDVPVVNVYGGSSGTLNLIAGDVAVGGDDPTQTGTVTTATINENSTLTVGPGCTVTTLNAKGGTVYAYGTVTTLNIISGEVTLYITPTTITADGGTVYGRYTGTTATVTLRGQGGSNVPTLDYRLDARARTITNHSVTGGAKFLDPDQTTVWSNGGAWDAASLAASEIGQRFTLLRT